jgi:hypothetical protein
MLRRALLVLDVLLVVATGALAVQLHRASTVPPVPLPAGPVATASGPAPAAERAPAPARPPASAFMVVAERNLFNSNRTETPPEPPKAAAKAAAAAMPPPPKPRLYGIVVMPDGRARAYLEDVQRRKVFAYSVGDSIAESRVETIAADRVVLRRGGETYEVLLRDPAKPKPPAPPQAANPFATRPGTVPTLPFGATPGGAPGALPFAPGASPFGQGTMAPSGPPAASPFAPRRRPPGLPGSAADPTRPGGQDAGAPAGEDD